eukprot:GHVU01080507.1.p1 GENE.GHVU01080507.1~~GHVU01080507.1.p1  ORF type:complete len:156 (-),score=10.29 GHVU01080507.1:138-605(-)
MDITIVSPKDPANKKVTRHNLITPDADWVDAVQFVLDQHHNSHPDGILKDWYKPGQALDGADFILYMRTDDGIQQKWSKLSKRMPATDYSYRRQFLLTGSKVSRQQRRGCCCSKTVTVRLSLDPGDDQNRKRSPCPTKEHVPSSFRVRDGCTRAT